MFNKNKLVAGIAMVAATISLGIAQNQQPTKNAPIAGIDTSWQDGLSNQDIRIVHELAYGKKDDDRWMIWTAIVRNREASRDMYKGEPLTTDKVLANVRVRMSTEESTRWTKTWSHLGSLDRTMMIQVLRDDISHRH
jgi:hypothetical protein